MLVSITDFSKTRNIDRDTVNAFIRNHSEIKKETKKQGKNIVIDTESPAFEILNKQYPLPQLVQVIEDIESKNKLIQAQEMIIQLQKQLNDQNKMIIQAEINQALLEDKNIMIDNLKIENEELKQKLEIERSKTWWQKLRKK